MDERVTLHGISPRLEKWIASRRFLYETSVACHETSVIVF